MKKYLFLGVMSTSLLASPVQANDTLDGDSKTACEVILCMSSGSRPAECNPPLKKYFSIKGKKLKDTLTKRKNFLKLCPQSDSSVEMKDLTEAIAQQQAPCTAEELNRKIERKHIQHQHDGFSSLSYRVTTTVPNYCHVIAEHQYTDVKVPKYVCDKKWYKAEDWQNGYVVLYRYDSRNETKVEIGREDVIKTCWVEQ
jgi:hypothetical protein